MRFLARYLIFELNVLDALVDLYVGFRSIVRVLRFEPFGTVSVHVFFPDVGTTAVLTGGVVGYTYLKGTDVAEVTRAIIDVHRHWPRAHISIETNGIGWPIFQSVSGPIPESKLHEFMTTQLSKSPRAR